jgi:hypothetical protein
MLVSTGIYSIKTNRYFDEDIMRDFESSYITYPYFVQAYCIAEGRPQERMDWKGFIRVGGRTRSEKGYIAL